MRSAAAAVVGIGEVPSGRFPERTEIEAAIIIRDRKDSTRDHSPLVEADDAITVDTTGMTIDEVVEHIMGML